MGQNQSQNPSKTSKIEKYAKSFDNIAFFLYNCISKIFYRIICGGDRYGNTKK